MHQIAPDPTVAEFLEFWLREHVAHNLRPRTGEGYATVVHRHLNPLLGQTRLRDLSSLKVLEAISAKREEGLSPRSLQYLHAVLRSALTSAVRLGLVERNAASGIPSPHYRSQRGAPLSQLELSCLVNAAQGHRNASLYLLAVVTGMRLGELLGLEWHEVREDLRAATVCQAIQRYEGRLRLVPPKGGRLRTILLGEAGKGALQAATRTKSPAPESGAWAGHDFVFPSGAGGPLEPRNVLRQFQRHLSSAGVTHRRFHDLRHTCATLLLEGGVHHRVVMEILGHSSISTTLDLYSHVSPQMQIQASRQIDHVMGKLVRDPVS